MKISRINLCILMLTAYSCQMPRIQTVVNDTSPLTEVDNSDQQYKLAVEFEKKQEAFKPFERDLPELRNQVLSLSESDLTRMSLDHFSPNILSAKLREMAGDRCMVLHRAPYHAVIDDEEYEGETELVPLEKTVKGARVMSMLVAQLNSGRVSCASYGICTTLFKAENRANPAEQFLLKCNVSWNNGAPSTPENCEVVAGWRQGRPWIKAIIARTAPRCPGKVSAPRPPYRIKVTGIAYRPMRKSIDAVINGLRAEPLSYQVETEEYKQSAVVVASAPHRPSPILSGWREQVKISIDFHGIELEGLNGDEGAGIGISVSIVLWLSKYNTNERKYWHPPEQNEEDLYANKITAVLLGILGKECNNSRIPMALNGSTVPCNVPVAAATQVRDLIVLPGQGRFSPVPFSHRQHQSGIQCKRCHHNWKDGNSEQAKAVSRCRVCHGYSHSESLVPPMQEAAHSSCRPCHEERGLDTSCRSCHKK